MILYLDQGKAFGGGGVFPLQHCLHCSDGVARIFTLSSDRVASSAELSVSLLYNCYEERLGRVAPF